MHWQEHSSVHNFLSRRPSRTDWATADTKDNIPASIEVANGEASIGSGRMQDKTQE
jgi:hypothetical protein